MVHMVAEDIATADKMLELMQNGQALMENADTLLAAGVSSTIFTRSSPTGLFAMSIISDEAKYLANRDTAMAKAFGGLGITPDRWLLQPPNRLPITEVIAAGP